MPEQTNRHIPATEKLALSRSLRLGSDGAEVRHGLKEIW